MVARPWRPLAGLALAALLGAAAWALLRGPTPADATRRQLDRLAELVRRDGPESLVATAAKRDPLRRLFANPVELAGAAGPVSGRHAPEELADLILRTRHLCRTLDFSYTDLAQTFPSGEAVLTFTARLRARSESGEQADEYRLVTARLRPVEGEWLFVSFTAESVMEK